MIRDRSLTLIFTISLITAIIFPVVSIYYIYPSFTDMLIHNTEEEAYRTGRYLSERLLTDSEPLSKSSISAHFAQEAESLQRNFKLMKLKVFTASGEIIYSTDERDIGDINSNAYFRNIVAAGRPYSAGIKKDAASLEGQVVTADVIETYIPVMKQGRFLGAFELYYDVTARNREMNRNIFLSSIIPMGLMLIFLVSIVTVLARAGRKGAPSTISESSLRYRSPFFSMAMIALSLFISEMIVFALIHLTPDVGSRMLQGTLASTLLILLISPTLYFFFVQPLIRYIAEHARIEQALQDSQAKLAEDHEQLQNMFQQVEVAKLQWERTMDCVADIILLADREGKLQRYNRSLDRLMGTSCRAYIGRDWKTLLPDLSLEPDPSASSREELIQKSSGRRFSINTSAFYHGDLNLCGTVITIHESSTKSTASLKTGESA